MAASMNAGSVRGICGLASTSGRAHTTFRTAVAAACRLSDPPRPSPQFVCPVATSLSFWSKFPLPGLAILASSFRRRFAVAQASGLDFVLSERGEDEDEKLGDEDEDVDVEDGDREEDDGEEEDDEEDEDYREKIIPTRARFEPLGTKERKELRAYAHGLGTRLDVQQVGKRGVIQSVVNSISDSLEANEILKVKVLENCPSDMVDVVAQLEWGTGGQVVGRIGRTVLLYRASLRKLAASPEQQRFEGAKRRPKLATPSRRTPKSNQRFRR